MPINADEVKWGPAPPNIPAGAQIAVLAGDPSSDGPYVVRLKMPGNHKVPAHYHPKDETVTVISGDFHVGMGDKLDMQKGLVLQPGGGYAPLWLDRRWDGRANSRQWTFCDHLRQPRG
jgi:hypothetical protein